MGFFSSGLLASWPRRFARPREQTSRQQNNVGFISDQWHGWRGDAFDFSAFLLLVRVIVIEEDRAGAGAGEGRSLQFQIKRACAKVDDRIVPVKKLRA